MFGQPAQALKKRYTQSPPLALPFSGSSATCISTLQLHQSTRAAKVPQEKRCLATCNTCSALQRQLKACTAYLIAERSQMFAA